jgi:DNA gyrase subunit A
VRKEREAIIITEVPYQVNKATMVEKIAELVREKRIEGISDLRDESSREGMRVVIESEARRLSRCGAQPALSLHAAADLVRLQLWWR